MKYAFNIWWRRRKTIYLEHRKDPVPYTGHKKNGRMFRRIKTFTERKWNCAHRELIHDFKINNLIRGRRSYKNLPEPWDDFLRMNDGIKSWKRHRRHQWKD